MDYFSYQFIIYLLRWIVSGIVILPFIYLLINYKCCKGKYQEYIHLILVQVIGAFIFYNIDKYIFK